jgi:hypothetical protein
VLPRLLATLIWTVASVTGAAADASLEISVPEGRVAVGDRVPVRVVARGGEDALWGELGVQLDELGPWELVDGPRSVAGAQPPAWELVLAPMVVGEEALPPIQVTLRSPEGEAVVVTPAETPMLSIASVLPPDEEVEPAPLRDPLGVRGFPWEWALPALLALSPLIAIGAWWLRRRRKSAATDPGSRVPPIEQFEALLDELSSRVGKEPAEGVCDQLASCFRRYLERRSGEPAQEMTSLELRGLARGNRWPEPVQRSLHHVMGVADRVRFAQRRAADEELRVAIDAARDAGRGLEGFLEESLRTAELSP